MYHMQRSIWQDKSYNTVHLQKMDKHPLFAEIRKQWIDLNEMSAKSVIHAVPFRG